VSEERINTSVTLPRELIEWIDSTDLVPPQVRSRSKRLEILLSELRRGVEADADS
jgi:hypothetical protein